jgi:hypothetical protein
MPRVQVFAGPVGLGKARVRVWIQLLDEQLPTPNGPYIASLQELPGSLQSVAASLEQAGATNFMTQPERPNAVLVSFAPPLSSSDAVIRVGDILFLHGFQIEG